MKARNYDTESRASTPTTDEDYGLFNHCAAAENKLAISIVVELESTWTHDNERAEVKVTVDSQSVELSHTGSSTTELTVGKVPSLLSRVHPSGGP